LPAPIISVSCHSPAAVIQAASEKADLAIFAPVFGKRGAATTPPVGIVALRDACRSDVPVLALGGVTLQNAASCLDAGAAGVAGIRLFQENKINDVVRVLREL
jgi:thiamine-phosphate pyrophosphorylase